MNAALAQNIAIGIGLLLLIGALGMGVYLYLANKRDKVAGASLPTAPVVQEQEETVSRPVFGMEEASSRRRAPAESAPGRRIAPAPATFAPAAPQPLTRRALRTQTPVSPAQSSSGSFFEDDGDDFDFELNQGDSRQ